MTQDPTAQEMRDFLAVEFASFIDPHEDPAVNEFDVEEAIYYFAERYHGGQASNLYSALSMSEFRPGMMQSGPETDSTSALMYESLVSEFYG